MGDSDRKLGKGFLVFTAICIILLPFIVFSAISYEPEEMKVTVIAPQNLSFDENGDAVFRDRERIAKEYLQGKSTERTLSEYYSRREYIGSPPYIPHKLEDEGETDVDCLSCHAKGGWTEELKRNTPLTPHPEHASCEQCHIKMTVETLFATNEWLSLPPPRLGRSYLPGAPSPIPHDLQMRGDCIACHVGPGTVTAIRVEHPSRGNCRQCHVPDSFDEPFRRE